MQISTYAQRLALFMFSMVLSMGMVFAQERTVSGKVTDESAGALPGVNVYIQGTTVGTITDLDGAFSLQVPGPDAVLVFSSVGFKTTTVTVGAQSVIDVGMESDVTSLQEVIVTGYTSQSKKNISGAVTSVEPDAIRTLPSANVGQQLQGRAAGVTVLQDGEPGGQVQVRVRGYGSVNDNNPLYIVDGTPVNQWTMQDLNPNDVESIQVLKDASAASIYGSRAANGVIIITTKSGSKTGKSNISFDGYYGVQQPGKMPELCSPQELADVIWAGKINGGVAPSHPQYGTGATPHIPDWIIPQGTDGSINTSDYDFYNSAKAYTQANKAGTDWLGEVFDPATIQNYNISASGGTENGQYALSAGYFDQQGVVITTNFKRYSMRANSSFNVKNRIKVGETLSLSYQESVGTPGGRSGSGNSISQAFDMPSIVPVYDIAGNWAGTRAPGMNNPGNPIATLQNSRNNVGSGIRLVGSVFAEVEVINGLKFKSSINSNFGVTFENRSYGYRTYWNAENNSNNSLSQASYNSRNWTWYNTLNYVKTFNNIHNLSILVGTEAIDDYYTEYGASRLQFFSDDISYRYLNTGESSQSNYGYGSAWALFSLFGKVDYDLDGKYILSATVRRDGSSRFSADNRYAIFPAFSAAWRISQESFMQGISFINDLKIRAGWGQTGNQNIGNYLVFDTYSTDIPTARYSIGGGNNSSASGFQSNTFGNPNVKWEATSTADIGLNLLALDNQLSFEFDWYKRTTSDMLLQVPVPSLRGLANNPYQNVGEMTNTGIDITALWNSKAGAALTYSVGLNFTQYTNELVKMYNADQFIQGGYWRENVATRSEEGHPIASAYGLKVLGIFQTQEEVNAAASQVGAAPGRFRFADVNGDNTINADDRTYIGNPHPDFTLGVPISLSFMNFDLNMFWYGSFGNDVVNANKLYWDFNGYFTNTNLSKDILKSWGMPGVNNASAELPQIKDGAPGTEQEMNSFYVEDGTYFRMSQLTLGYNLPSGKVYERFRIYLQGNNLLTFTGYTGLDPMIASSNPNDSGGDLNNGVDVGQYPVVKSFMLGVNVTF